MLGQVPKADPLCPVSAIFPVINKQNEIHPTTATETFCVSSMRKRYFKQESTNNTTLTLLLLLLFSILAQLANILKLP